MLRRFSTQPWNEKFSYVAISVHLQVIRQIFDQKNKITLIIRTVKGPKNFKLNELKVFFCQINELKVTKENTRINLEVTGKYIIEKNNNNKLEGDKPDTVGQKR